MSRTKRTPAASPGYLRQQRGRRAAKRAALDGGVRPGAIPPDPWSDEVVVGREARLAARLRAKRAMKATP